MLSLDLNIGIPKRPKLRVHRRRIDRIDRVSPGVRIEMRKGLEKRVLQKDRKDPEDSYSK